MVKFKKIETEIEGLYIIEPTVFGDQRGFFMETWNKKDFEEIGIKMNFVQDNHSKSAKGVLRGIHFQERHPQGKLVRCIKGTVLDVAIDLREGSQTFGEYYKVILSGENKKQFLIPEGFGHAFVSLEDETEFLYKATDYYCRDCEGGIMYNDASININWDLKEYGIDKIILSEKDKKQPSLNCWLDQREQKGL